MIGFSDTAEDTPAAGDAAILATTVADAAVGDSTVAAASALVDVDAAADAEVHSASCLPQLHVLDAPRESPRPPQDPPSALKDPPGSLFEAIY